MFSNLKPRHVTRTRKGVLTWNEIFTDKDCLFISPRITKNKQFLLVARRDLKSLSKFHKYIEILLFLTADLLAVSGAQLMFCRNGSKFRRIRCTILGSFWPWDSA